MAENSHISWTDHTFNPWVGCTNVGPGCDHCYAENWGHRFGVEWGTGKPRRRTSIQNWNGPRKWNRTADAFREKHGHFPRVFSASLADIFDNEIDPAWRADFWELVSACSKLQWLIVTKRIPNVLRMLPANWCEAGYRNVVLLITVVNQEEANRDIARLLKLKATYPWLQVGLSIEPMLGPVDLENICFKDGDADIRMNVLNGEAWVENTSSAAAYTNEADGNPKIDWVITGGESAQMPGSRPLVPLEAQWVRDIARDCEAAGVAHHFKQWGYTIPERQVRFTDKPEDAKWIWADYPGSRERRLIYADWMSRTLDGREHNGFPKLLEIG
jgi:protein gp37